MRNAVKKWIAIVFEISFFIGFSAFGLLFRDEIQRDWARFRTFGTAPIAIFVWVLFGLFLYLSRMAASRFALQQQLGVLTAPEFLQAYSQLVGAAIDTMRDIDKARASPEVAVKTQKDLLVAIASTVTYFRKASALREVQVTCDLMLPQPPPAEHEQIRFLEEGGREHLSCVLTVANASRTIIDMPANLRLPVYKEQTPYAIRTALGAPKAFATSEIQVVPFSLWLWPHRGQSSRRVLFEIMRYFWSVRRQLLSFASLPVSNAGHVRGVVNVRCNTVRLLGKDPKLVLHLIFPFLIVLGYTLFESDTENV